ncbi:glycosyltransferase family 4 protein [Aeromonas enteropelogenes]|uniref:glycosyltransferase family 4 protein n=1 Tax=Aeromonas enteropelogenes TaxID=29489 RepID=UPI00191CBA20|nr:glycosyltransferase family 4 protein [Aeromonas enteropelogenes]MBL0455922.1 glycosyltransferase family 4 protein [Aeromonas enteropelogenes]
MKIYYLVSSFKVSGLTKIIFNTAKELADKHDITVVELNGEKESKYKEELVRLGVRFVNIDFKGVNFFDGIKKIKNIINTESPDVVHAHCFRSIVATSFISNKTKSKTVCTLHSYVPYNYIGEFGVVRAKLYSKVLISRARFFDAAVAVSESVKELYLRHDKLKTYAICNGVEVFDEKMTHHNHIFDYIYTGSVSERKKVKELCLAFGMFIKEYPSKKLAIVGDGPLTQELKLQLSSENIVFLGRVDDVEFYLSRSKFFISASESEGLPNSVMEAMAVGLPCLLSDIPPHRELVDSVQKNHIKTFYYNNIDSIVKTLVQSQNLDESTYDEISNNLKRKILNKYNIREMAKEHERLYRRLL